MTIILCVYFALKYYITRYLILSVTDRVYLFTMCYYTYSIRYFVMIKVVRWPFSFIKSQSKHLWDVYRVQIYLYHMIWFFPYKKKHLIYFTCGGSILDITHVLWYITFRIFWLKRDFGEIPCVKCVISWINMWIHRLIIFVFICLI